MLHPSGRRNKKSTAAQNASPAAFFNLVLSVEAFEGIVVPVIRLETHVFRLHLKQI